MVEVWRGRDVLVDYGEVVLHGADGRATGDEGGFRAGRGWPYGRAGPWGRLLVPPLMLPMAMPPSLAFTDPFTMLMTLV